MKKFLKGFAFHAMWATLFILLLGASIIIKGIFTKGSATISFDSELKNFIEGWLGICGPYLLLQIFCYLIYKRFYYLAFLITWAWTPKGYKHDPKDGVFSGLWMLFVIVLGAMYHH